MQKTKLGISVGLLGAAICFAVLFGGYIPAILLVGYVLLFEENEWLKRTGVKAVALTICLGALTAAIDLIPDVLGWIAHLVVLFEGHFDYHVVANIISLITSAISIAKTCLFLVLGIKALNQSTITIPFVDKFINKYI